MIISCHLRCEVCEEFDVMRYLRLSNRRKGLIGTQMHRLSIHVVGIFGKTKSKSFL